MIVYGDPAFDADLGEFTAQLWARAEAVRAALPGACMDDPTGVLTRLDSLRGLLVQVGQCEQAVADAAAEISSPPCVHSVEGATLHAANAFVSAWLAIRESWAGWQSVLPGVCQHVQEVKACLRDPRELPHGCAQVKIPEGFAFYALYPEQYIQATLDWLVENGPGRSRNALVIGIRSIGTTLSAVVAAVLTAHGWTVRRMTLRPSGHPFERKAEIPRDLVGGADYGLVVDEGPGLSGSSMAAVAAALVRGGLDPTRICFLPGHEHPPGQAASPEVRRWWAETRRYVRSLDSLRWAAQSLTELIADVSSNLVGSAEAAVRVEDLGAGQWRAVVFDSSADWPAVCAPFERTKYRCVFPSGSPLLWKFSGFAGGPGGGNDCVLGFAVSPWISGVPLARADASDSVVAQIGRHVAKMVGRLMSPAECRRSWQRLAHMLYWNVREALGESAAERLRGWAEENPLDTIGPLPACGDGHLAPHAWLRQDDGRLVKTGCSGHCLDHTMVGRQPVTWDVAGAIVEWNLDERESALLIQAAQEAGLEPIAKELLKRYEAAYAGFRLGQCTMCGQMAGWQTEEGIRLKTAAEHYEGRIKGIMSTMP